MEAVLLSLHSKWVKKIINGEKIYEVRKRAPICSFPFKVYIYCTKKCDEQYLAGITGKRKCYKLNGTVCGEFTCKQIFYVFPPYKDKTHGTCLTAKELYEYDGGSGKLNYLEISNPVLYDVPKSLSDFGMERPPQSWMYCKELCDE